MTTQPAESPAWVVVDASVWVSRLVPQDVNHEASRRWLDSYTAGGGRLVAPVILFVEIAGAIARRTTQSTLAQQAVAQVRLAPHLHIVAVDVPVGLEATRLAAELRLRGADAIYVAVAHLLHIPLVTWDAEQQERARPLIVTYTPASAPL